MKKIKIRVAVTYALLALAMTSCVPRTEIADSVSRVYPEVSGGESSESSAADIPDAPGPEQTDDWEEILDEPAMPPYEPAEAVSAGAADAPIFIFEDSDDPDIDMAAERSLTPSREGDVFIDLEIPPVFNITRPLEKINTTYGSYFITGTSDPSLPVYFGDEEIERQGVTGVFGVHVALEMGENIFSFSQNGETIDAVIVRKAEEKTTTIDFITQSSMFPSLRGGAKSGEVLPLRCVAPSGAVVTAAFGGVTARLVQAADASEGIPAVYTGRLTVGEDYAEDITERIGPVTYVLEYKGKRTEYQSSGDVFVAGRDSALAAEVASYAGFIYTDASGSYNFKEKVKGGARDYIVGQTSSYFELASGGYIPIEAAIIVEGEVKVSNAVSSPSETFSQRFESYSFDARRMPVYYTEITDESFSITLYNTSGTPAVDPSGGRLFSTASAKRVENGVTYTFAFKNRNLLWGYNISFDDGLLTLKFKYRPKLSGDSEKPLSGIRILLDPGHGGADPGASGVPGLTGPPESSINLAHAYIARDRLEELGAVVFLTRQADEWLHLDTRLQMIEALDADIFLSLHHNSVAESADANKPSGMEIYYHTDFSAELADSVMEGLALGVNRNNRFVKRSVYRVTLMPYAPSLLLELGFMSNPLEYERMTNPLRMRQVADAIAAGVYRALA